MGIEDTRIYLENQWNTYYAGQTVNGRVEFVFDRPKKVRGIFVNFKGEAHTYWTESETRQTSDAKERNVVDRSRTGHEEYFRVNYYVLGNKGAEPIEIPTGQHVYTFNCVLPPVLPSSFEGKFGYVRYTVKVTLDRPWKFNQDVKLAFTVLNPLDLNLNPSYREPIIMQQEKTFCCLFCASAPLCMDVYIPYAGYCPGQIIPIEVIIDNMSNVHVNLVKVYLRMLVTFRATSPQNAVKKWDDVITELSEGPVNAYENKHLSFRMEVPSTPPSNLVNCSIIDLDYDIKVECATAGLHSNLSTSKYITIGTVPLIRLPTSSRILSEDQPESSRKRDVEGGDAGWVEPSAPPYQALYPMLGNPVYKESIHSARTVIEEEDSEHTRITGVGFAPHYPTYGDVEPPALPN